MGGLALILGVLALTHTVAIWQVYALAFALGLVTVVDNPTRQAFAAEMVGRGGHGERDRAQQRGVQPGPDRGPGRGRPGHQRGRARPAAFLVNAASYGAVLISLKLMRPSELHAGAAAAPGQGAAARGACATSGRARRCG